jgi:ABC-type dipeptide/oligopeptide/nickel transport system ATPase component
LDVTIQAEVLDLLGNLISDSAASALIATRDLGIVAEHCSRVVVLREGAIVESAPVAEFFRSPREDYSAGLLAAEFDVLSSAADALSQDPEATAA